MYKEQMHLFQGAEVGSEVLVVSVLPLSKGRRVMCGGVSKEALLECVHVLIGNFPLFHIFCFPLYKDFSMEGQKGGGIIHSGQFRIILEEMVSCPGRC